MKNLFSILCLNLCLGSILMPVQHSAAIVEKTMTRAMSYDMKPVLERYKRDFKVDDSLVTLHHQELMRYLVMCALLPKESIEMMSKDIDNLWHTFILFTKNYARFCTQVAGHFLHHAPNVSEQKNNLREKAEKFMNVYVALFREKPNSSAWNELYTLDEQAECKKTCRTCESLCVCKNINTSTN